MRNFNLFFLDWFDNQEMSESSVDGLFGEQLYNQQTNPKSPPTMGVELPPHWADLMEQIRLREEEMKRLMLSRRSDGGG